MSIPTKVEGKDIVVISKKGCYGKAGCEDIVYIAIGYDKQIPAYISYDLNGEFEVLNSLVWDGDTLADCKLGLQTTYSTTIEWTEAWKHINNQDDIEEFMKITMGMHDSYLVGLDYMPGIWGDAGNTFFAGPASRNLRVIFDSAWLDGKIEMVFETVCRFNIAGWQECYSDEIFQCYMKLEKLKKTSDEEYILWTTGGSPKACEKEELLSEPMDTYIVSKSVRWRVANLKFICPCCGYYTFENLPMGEFSSCPVCGWLDNADCLRDLDYVNAGLGVSLRQARKNYLLNKACAHELESETRLPMESELEGINWIMPNNI